MIEGGLRPEHPWLHDGHGGSIRPMRRRCPGQRRRDRPQPIDEGIGLGGCDPEQIERVSREERVDVEFPVTEER